jgi:hypothetical protein
LIGSWRHSSKKITGIFPAGPAVRKYSGKSWWRNKYSKGYHIPLHEKMTSLILNKRCLLTPKGKERGLD